jgi:hypothetical protein
MLGRWKRIVRHEGAQDLAEYGIALGLVGAVAVAAALAMSIQIGTLWDSAQGTISGVVQGEPGNHGNGNHGHGHGGHGDNGHHHGGGNGGNGGGKGGGK